MRLFSRKILRRILLSLVCLGLLLILAQEWPDRSSDEYLYRILIQNRSFDFVSWELNALGSKFLYCLAPPHSYLTQETQKEIVLSYFDQLREVQLIEWQIASIFADPEEINPDAAAVDLNQERNLARARLEELQALAEGILEEQVATVLSDNQIKTAGRTFPPVQIRFTPLPGMLIVSPRDRIQAIHFFPLEHGMDTSERAALEEAIDTQLNVSSLVSNIGGLAAYPAMLLESSSLNWVIQTSAHEWTHHYLTLHPLGLLYSANPQLRTMNETTASIVGTEIGNEVIRRFYPEFAPPEPSPAAELEASPAPEPPAFDFRAEMRSTRLRVDELLAQGQIEEAESYMEARRQVFWENGYQIRKLNQAYFAFHGAYADEPGATGSDPVGPAVLELRSQSASLKEFLQRMASMTSFSELEASLKQ